MIPLRLGGTFAKLNGTSYCPTICVYELEAELRNRRHGMQSADLATYLTSTTRGMVYYGILPVLEILYPAEFYVISVL